MNPNPKNYLLLLHNPSAEAARHAWSLCRKLNIPVPIQHGSIALEVIATPDEAERLSAYGIFATLTARRLSKEQLEKLSPQAQEIVTAWNQQFSADYQRRKKDKTNHGLKYTSPGKKEPAPYADVDVRQFKKLVTEELKRRKTDPSKIKRTLKVDVKRVTAESFLKVKSYIREQVGNDKVAYQLSRIYALMKETDRAMFLSPELIRVMQDVYKEMKSSSGGSKGPTGGCRKMHGRNSVGIVFVESSKAGGPKYTTTTRNEILAEIKAGLSWLVVKHPTNDLSWTFDVQNVKIDVANKADKDADELEFDDYWREAGIGKVKFDGNTYLAEDAAIDAYRGDMQTKHDSQASIVIFVTPYGSRWHAYSVGERYIVLSDHGNNWGTWGQDDLNIITAHEMCHQFGAADEYTGNGTPCDSCGGEHGCDNIPNGNCEACAEPSQCCVMGAHELYMCQYTRAQIGWSDIFIELFTEDETWAGTDDKVWLDIGNRKYVLDIGNHNDRESGNREGHAIWDGGDLSKESIRRILIRKAADSGDGGWKLKRVRVFHQGEVVCDKSPHQWLEDGKLWFLGCTFEDTMVNKIKLKVTTADVAYAGTDGDVTLKMGGRSWDLNGDGNDFESGDTNTFVLDPKNGLHVSDLKTITIQKSGDGIFGGWKLKGLQLIVNDKTIYNKQSINKWLEDDSLIFTDEI